MASFDVDLLESSESIDLVERRFSAPRTPSVIAARPAYDFETLNAARRLHASVYLDRGYVQANELTEDGLYIDLTGDPYQTHCQYFVAEVATETATEIVAVARLILFDNSKKSSSFPMLSDAFVSDSLVGEALSGNLERSAEISALAKVPGAPSSAVTSLYEAMFRFAVERGLAKGFMLCDARLTRLTTRSFGDKIKSLGDKVFHKGHFVVPMIFEPNGTSEANDWLNLSADRAIRAADANHNEPENDLECENAA